MALKDALQPGTKFELTEVKSGTKQPGTVLDLERALREQKIMFPSGSQTPKEGFDFLYDDHTGKLGHLDGVKKVTVQNDATIRISTREAIYTLSILSKSVPLSKALKPGMKATVSKDTFVDLGEDSDIKLPAGTILTYIAGGSADNDYIYFIISVDSKIELKLPSSAAENIPVEA